MHEPLQIDALEYAESSAWASASVAAALFAIDPELGILLRSWSGPVREQWLRYLRTLMPATTPVRVPAQVSDDRLLGGLDLGATLKAGKPIAERGLLAAADGGVLLLAMAERLPAGTAARIAATLDTHEVSMHRDGLSNCTATRFGVIALDEGLSDDERPPPALQERLAMHLDLGSLSMRDVAESPFTEPDIIAARQRLPTVTIPQDIIESLCTTAYALGIDSLRAAQLSIKTARAAAALGERSTVSVDDATLAGRLVLASRATRLPQQQADSQQPESQSQPEQSENASPESAAEASSDPQQQDEQQDEEQGTTALNDLVLAATQAAIPAGLLNALKAGTATGRARTAGRAGVLRQASRGRPIGVRKSELRAGVRLNLLATLRAAAPWQQLRQREAQDNVTRIRIRPEDFHITRFRQRTETTTIFMLDASGSSALHRLAEAKGAVELLLADCYIRRDQVAVLSFRDRHAQILLAPTRSLVRAKRSLADLPGGGGTPLAAGIEAGLALAESIQRRGITPTLVLLTDGRANVTRAGQGGRELAQQEAMQAARRVRVAGIGSLLIDTSARPQALGQQLAAELGARYLPLPYADASMLARAVQSSRLQ